jgi:hypothetical protein
MMKSPRRMRIAITAITVAAVDSKPVLLTRVTPRYT